jgi:pimeloyl-ACP methyl ester carboxylesterase
MGSQLIRAVTPHQDGPHFSYDTAWLDFSVLLGGVTLDLRMQGEIDQGHRFVITDGCVDLPGLQPYREFIQWCEQNHLDWFIFGWDWRRTLDDTVDLFLNRFLPMFQRRVVAACAVDPLQDFALIGHSMGGMVVKLILNRGGPFVDSMSHAVTVATPFYGHGGHVHRYFKGDPLFNKLDGTANVTEAIATMPGGYTLLFLDKETYDRDKYALERDQEYPLLSYPSVDADDPAIIADPYDPQKRDGKVRYPEHYGFDHVKLRQAKKAYQQVAAPLTDPAIVGKFYNIRGVRVAGATTISDTVNSQTWTWISPNFNPDTDCDPISDVTYCPGDGLIPAWSARLLSAGTTITIKDEFDLMHMFMMNLPATHDVLARILRMTAPKRKSTGVKHRRRPAAPRIATQRQLMDFLGGLADDRKKRATHLKPEQDRTDLNYLAKHKPEELKALLRRAYGDLLKSPSQKVGTAPTPEPPRKAASRKPVKAPPSRRTK